MTKKKKIKVTQADMTKAMELYDRFKDNPALIEACGKQIFVGERDFWHFVAGWILANVPEPDRISEDRVTTMKF
jgi:hypothetical protein